jgi:hypothetical protein
MVRIMESSGYEICCLNSTQPGDVTMRSKPGRLLEESTTRVICFDRASRRNASDDLLRCVPVGPDSRTGESGRRSYVLHPATLDIESKNTPAAFGAQRSQQFNLAKEDKIPEREFNETSGRPRTGPTVKCPLRFVRDSSGLSPLAMPTTKGRELGSDPAAVQHSSQVGGPR